MEDRGENVECPHNKVDHDTLLQDLLRMSSNRNLDTNENLSTVGSIPTQDAASNQPSRRSRTRRISSSSSDRVLHGTVRGGISQRSSSSILKKSNDKSRSTRTTSVRGRKTNGIPSRNNTESHDAGSAMSIDPIDFSDEESQSVPKSDDKQRSRHRRSDVLAHFTEEIDGYRCKICKQVSLSYQLLLQRHNNRTVPRF